VIREGSHVDFPKAGWFWNSNEQFAFGPGVHCFSKGNEYAHGGVSLQERLTPDITLSSGRKPAIVSAKILEIKWSGMRCRAIIDAEGSKVTADLRTRPNDSNSSVAIPKTVDKEGRVGLLVEDDSLEGTVVSLVIIDASGLVTGKQATTIGGDE